MIVVNDETEIDLFAFYPTNSLMINLGFFIKLVDSI
jgi:hypothetical protein